MFTARDMRACKEPALAVAAVEDDDLNFAEDEELSPTQVCSTAPLRLTFSNVRVRCNAIRPFRTQTPSEMTPALASQDDDEINDRYGSLASIIAVLQDQYSSDASGTDSGGGMELNRDDVPLGEWMLAAPVESCTPNPLRILRRHRRLRPEQAR